MAQIRTLAWLIAIGLAALLTSQAQDITITKPAQGRNPTIYIRSFDGDAAARRQLENDLKYVGWFELTTNPETADYQLAASYANTGRLELRLADPQGNPVTGIAIPGSPDQMSRAVHAGVDSLVQKVFDNPGFCSTKLLYVKQIGTRKEIYEADFDGSNPRQLTHNGTLSVEPQWGPKNRHMIYTAYTRTATKLVLVDMQREQQQILAGFPGLNSSGSISPDSRNAAMVLSRDGQVDLYLMNLQNQKLRRLTRDRGNEASPSWSPDGKKIVFVSDGQSSQPTLLIMDANGGRATRLLDHVGEAVSPDWSHRSGKICFAVKAGGNYHIAVIDEGSPRQQPVIITNAAGDWEAPSWAADGRHIVCSRNHGGKRSLYLLDSTPEVIDGQKRFRPAKPLHNFSGNDSLPDYSDHFR